MELEENNSIPFLDVLVSKKYDGSLSHHGFHKKTHIEQYLHDDSHHHPSQKIRVINTLAFCALIICDDEHLDQQEQHLIKIFEDRGYKKWHVEEAF